MRAKTFNRLLCVLLAGFLSVGSVCTSAFASESEAVVENEEIINLDDQAAEYADTAENDEVLGEAEEIEDGEIIQEDEVLEEEVIIEENLEFEDDIIEDFSIREIESVGLAAHDYSTSYVHKAADLNAISATGDYESKGYSVEQLPPNGGFPTRLAVNFYSGTVTVTDGKVQKQCNNDGARILDGYFDEYPFSNVVGEICGGTYIGGIYQKSIKGMDSPDDWNQIIIDEGKTIKIGGVGLVVTNGNVINKGTMDLSGVDLGRCITKTGIFRSSAYISKGHLFQNDGLIILPSGADETFIKGLKITGTGKIRIGAEEYANDYDAAAEAMLAFKASLPVVSAESSNMCTYYNQPVAEIDLSQYVKGGTKPYTFRKTGGPEWIHVSADGIISGTPTELGIMPNCTIEVTDKAGTSISKGISVKPCYKEVREEVDLLEVASNMDFVAYAGEPVRVSPVTFDNVSGIKLRFDTSSAKWQKKTGSNTYVDVTSGYFEENATYRLSGITINNNAEDVFEYQFDISGIKVYMNGTLCAITSKRGSVAPTFYSSVKIDSPDIVVKEKRFEGEGTITSPWTGLQADDNLNIIQAWIKDGVLEIRGTGAIKEYTKAEDYPWYPYRNYIKTVVFDRYITNVPTYAFEGFSTLQTVIFKGANTQPYDGCFKNCTSLTSISLSARITRLWSETFMGCSSLETIAIPDTVTTMQLSVFEGCRSLKEVSLSESLKAVPNRAFYGCVSLEELDIPKTVENIGNEAFYGCKNLKAIDLHQDTARTTGKIGANAFENCTSLKDIDFGKYKTISEYAFKSCSALEAVVFPETIGFIDTNAFQYCTKLNTVVFEGNIEPGVGIKNAFSGLGVKNGISNPKAYFPIDWPYSVPDSSTLWCGGYFDGEKAPDGELLGIEISTPPSKIAYKKGETFDPTGMTVMAHYSNNTDLDVTSRCTFAPVTPLDTFNNTITVSFTSKGVTKNATTNVYVIELQSIEVVTAPSKVRYIEGELFDPSGVKVLAHYTANIDEDVTARCTFTPSTSLHKSDEKITVSFTELAETKTTEIPIRVFSDELLEIRVEKMPDKTLYKEGESFDKSGLKLIAYFADETDADVTNNCSFTPAGPLVESDTKITASYTKGLITKTAEISVEVAADFDIEFSEYNDTYSGKAINPAVTVRDNNLKTLLKKSDYKLFYNNNVMPNAGSLIDSKISRYSTEEKVTLKKNEVEQFLAGKTLSELGAFDPSLPYVAIQGAGNYSGTTFINYNISPVVVFDTNEPTAKTLITIPEGFEVGKAVSAIAKFTSNKKALALGKDYTFEIWQGGNLIVSGVSGKAPLFKPEVPGNYTLRIFCKGGYAGTYDTNLYAAAKTELLSTAKVVVGANVKNVNFDVTNNAGFVKNGSRIEFANESTIFANSSTKDKNKIMVTVGKNYLTTDDFTVSYKNNEAVGTATVVLTPKVRTPYEIANGAIQYVGTKTFTFNITGKKLNAGGFTIDGVKNLPGTTFDGKAWTLERLLGYSYVVENDGVVLTKGTNYKVSYLKNVNKGTATVVFEGIPAGGYTGTIKKSVKINPMTIDSSMLSVDPQYLPAVTFTKMGGTIDSSIRMRLPNGYKLNYGTDYTVRYGNNKKWGDKAYLVIDGKGNFKGTTGQIRFNTVKKKLSDGYNDGINYFGDRSISVKIDPIAFVNNSPSKKYTPKVKVYDGTSTLTQGKEFSITLINFDTATIQNYMNDRVGNYALRPQVKLSAANIATCGYTGELIVDVPIKEKQLTMLSLKDSKLSVSLGEVRYNGSVLYAPVTIMYDNVMLVEGQDYTLQYGRSITGKGTVTVCGIGEYYGSVQKTYEIKGKDIK